MEELKSTETVASQFDRCDEPPYFRRAAKTSSQDSVVESRKTHTTEQDGVTPESNGHAKANAAEEIDGRKESREERVECKDDRKEKMDSLERGSLVPLEDGEVDHSSATHTSTARTRWVFRFRLLIRLCSSVEMYNAGDNQPKATELRREKH